MSEIIAIDLGTTKLVAVAGVKNERGYFQIKALCTTPSEGIKYGEVQNIGSVVEKLKIIINNLKEITKIDKIENVYVGIAGQHVRYIENSFKKLRQDCDVEISEAELKELENNIRETYLEPGEVILEVVPKKYTIDDENDIHKPVGRLGRQLIGHFHVLIGKASSRKHTEMCMDKLNLKAKAIILEPIASSRAVLNEEERQIGVAVVDMGGGTTDLIVYINNVMQHTAVIPFGCNVITSDIEQIFDLPRARAESIKIAHGTCDPSKFKNQEEFTVVKIEGRPPITISSRLLAEVIRARVAEIIDMVLNEIKPYNEELKHGAGIVFTGGGARMDGIKEFITIRSGMHVKIGIPNYIASDSQKDVTDSIYSTAIGLVMCGSDDLEEKIKTPFDESDFVPVNEEKRNTETTRLSYGIRKLKNVVGEFFTIKEEEV
ncbi:MAG: cell division protein FtsA [Prevotellaceae bacterium]|jgi:cell division protein FtsA|nr:cell division protein FtsA [Prevotellaceae bacterium]